MESGREARTRKQKALGANNQNEREQSEEEELFPVKLPVVVVEWGCKKTRGDDGKNEWELEIQRIEDNPKNMVRC